MDADRICLARRAARGDAPCDEPPKFVVVTRTPDRRVILTSVPACFTHGLAEVERAHRAAGIAPCDLEPYQEDHE